MIQQVIAVKGLISAVLKRTRYGTWTVRLELKTEKSKVRLVRKLRLIGVFVKEVSNGD